MTFKYLPLSVIIDHRMKCPECMEEMKSLDAPDGQASSPRRTT
ncbi:MAG: hypothetical protein ACE5GY_08825 [Thermodesulfobacteriota bacterium]